MIVEVNRGEKEKEIEVNEESLTYNLTIAIEESYLQFDKKFASNM